MSRNKYLMLLFLFVAIVNCDFISNHLDREVEEGQLSGPTPIVLWHGMGDTCCASGNIDNSQFIICHKQQHLIFRRFNWIHTEIFRTTH